MAQQAPDYWVTSQQFTPKTYQTQYAAIDPTSKSNSLSGKVVIITGASKGMGIKGIVPAFAKAGPKGLVLVARSADNLKVAEAEVHKINPSVKTLVVPMDMSDASAVTALFAKIKETFGHADVLINNAGAFNSKGSPLIHQEEDDAFWSNFEVNVKGTFLLVKHFISQLPSPESSPAVIVNLSTGGSTVALPFMAAYVVSKLAGQQLVANFAAAYPHVTAINIHPGLYDTDLLNENFRIYNLDDFSLIGGTLVWLAKDPERSSFLSGRMISANWDVDGLVARKKEILDKNLLTVEWKGPFGKEQFDKKE